MKILEFLVRITIIMKHAKFQCEKQENHESLRISYLNYENHEYHRIQTENNENYENI